MEVDDVCSTIAHKTMNKYTIFVYEEMARKNPVHEYMTKSRYNVNDFFFRFHIEHMNE